MLISKIKYVYENGKLIGVKILTFNGESFSIKEVYVGIQLDINDVLSNPEVADKLGIDDINTFCRRYNACLAQGIVYFPQSGSYSFMDGRDEILPWSEEINVEEQLANVVLPYKETQVNDEVFMHEIDSAFDPEDPLLEMLGIENSSLTLSRVSER